ncbi:MAG: HAMP domain-containing histidine kinase [Bdellovibrionales bacterium]|jgi:signal transduction histidine kinase|nr:HAMP domain-containing histidine kinase [Bdellovibrionales bacterium]MBT3525205.1 HAMP domain-containing histidine kinase [Bdellovibrionales bacterium]
MINNQELTILFEISLSIIDSRVDDRWIKRIVQQIVRILNCRSGRIYLCNHPISKGPVQILETISAPKVDTTMDAFFNQHLKNKLDDQGEREELLKQMPLSSEYQESFFYQFHLPDTGFLILKRRERDLSRQFLQLFGQIVDKLSISIRNQQLERKMESATHLINIGELASGIGHELSNPAIVLRGGISKLIQSHENGDTQGADRGIELIQRSSNKMIDIIKSMQYLSRSDANTKLQPIPLQMVLNDAEFFCKNLFVEKKVPIQFPDILSHNIVVLGRSTSLSQVLLNLIKNSFDAIKDGPEDRWIKVQIEETAESVSIIIQDSGKGITPELHKQLFNPFFTTKVKGKGTGIGLSLSRQMIESQGGTLICDENQANSTFIITLKRTESPFPI